MGIDRVYLHIKIRKWIGDAIRRARGGEKSRREQVIKIILIVAVKLFQINLQQPKNKVVAAVLTPLLQTVVGAFDQGRFCFISYEYQLSVLISST